MEPLDAVQQGLLSPEALIQTDRAMGGWGSGRQGDQLTIEDCGSCRLSTKSARRLLRAPTGGDMQLLYRADGHPISVAIEVRPNFDYLRLQHRPRAESRTKHMDYTVGLVSTEVGFSGRRWWFLCPISGHRCAVLYLPRGAYKFGSAKGYGQDRRLFGPRRAVRRMNSENLRHPLSAEATAYQREGNVK